MYSYDLFISHTIEDKIGLANELNFRLSNRGFNVLFESCELRIGDNLNENLNYGLSKASKGIILLSESYLSKIWEYNDLLKILNDKNMSARIYLYFHQLQKQQGTGFSTVIEGNSLADIELEILSNISAKNLS